MSKSVRKVTYKVMRGRANNCYYIIVPYHPTFIVKKTKVGWYSCGIYHKTLRDAIIFCAYGI